MLGNITEHDREFGRIKPAVQSFRAQAPRVEAGNLEGTLAIVRDQLEFAKQPPNGVHTLPTTADYRSRAAVLTPQLVRRRAFLVGFGDVEGAHTQRDDLVCRPCLVDDRPAAGADPEIDAEDQIIPNVRAAGQLSHLPRSRGFSQNEKFIDTQAPNLQSFVWESVGKPR